MAKKPIRGRSPLGNARRINLSLDPATLHMMRYVADRDNLSLSEACSQLVLGYTVQVPELHSVLREKVEDTVNAELIINGMTPATKQVVSEGLLGREE